MMLVKTPKLGVRFFSTVANPQPGTLQSTNSITDISLAIFNILNISPPKNSMYIIKNLLNLILSMMNRMNFHLK